MERDFRSMIIDGRMKSSTLLGFGFRKSTKEKLWLQHQDWMEMEEIPRVKGFEPVYLHH